MYLRECVCGCTPSNCQEELQVLFIADYYDYFYHNFSVKRHLKIITEHRLCTHITKQCKSIVKTLLQL